MFFKKTFKPTYNMPPNGMKKETLKDRLQEMIALDYESVYNGR